MWRFILLSFVFLGLGFYELSGGAEYRPSANSIQMRAKLDNQRPNARPLRVNVVEVAPSAADLPERSGMRTVTSLNDLGLSMTKRVDVTLASVAGSAVSRPSAAVGLGAADIMVPTVSLATPDVSEDTPQTAQPLAPVAETRRVAGRSVNLRTGPGTAFGAIASLARDTEVTVLRNPGTGWVKLRVIETGRTGWMADRLLTVASD